MKNIWKLFMVVMMAFAIVACQQPGTSTDDDSSSTPASSVAADSSSTAASSNAADPSSNAADPSSTATDPSSTATDPSSNGADPSSNGGDDSSTPEGGDEYVDNFDYPHIAETLPPTAADAWEDFIDFAATDTTIDGVYKIEGTLSSISGQWGGSKEVPQFSVLFLNSTGAAAIAAGTDLKQNPAGSPAFQLQGCDNASFLTSTDNQNAMVYKGLVADVDASNDAYTLYLDMSQIKKGQLKGLGMDFAETGNEVVLQNAPETVVNLTGCKPYVLALVEGDLSIGKLWGADVVAMEESDEPMPEPYVAEIVTCHIRIDGPMFLDNGNDTTSDDIQNVHLRLLNVNYNKGLPIPLKFYCDGLFETNEPAVHGELLTVTLTEQDMYYAWEYTDNDMASSLCDFRKKGIFAGVPNKWLEFDLTDDAIDCADWF